MHSDREQQQDLTAVADVLAAWAEAVRADTPVELDAARAERNRQMADVLLAAAEGLRARAPGDALFDAIRRASLIEADGVPAGFELAQVYTDGREVVVCGRPLPDDPDHDCTRMGCGPSAHVIFRYRAADEAEEEK